MIPVAGPSITDLEVAYVADAARHAWYADHYRFNKKFEELFASYVGRKHAISLPHATSGLHLSLAALGIGPGDEVIVPDVTWIASVAPVAYVGATPVLVTSLTDTWCIDPKAVEAAITPRTKAVIGVDLYGSMCDWPALTALAERHGLHLIEDAAEALGSTMGDRKAGKFGASAFFSFHGSKTVVTGEGGMVATDDDHLAQRMHSLRDHGRPPGDRFFQNDEIAFKYKMSAVQAALGLAQMERIDELIAMKRQIFAAYQERLGRYQAITLNAEPAGTSNSYWMVTLVPQDDFGLNKFELMARLREKGIDTRPFFSPLSELKAFANRPDSLRHVDPHDPMRKLARRSINLPSGYHMVDEDKVARVCDAVIAVMGL